MAIAGFRLRNLINLHKKETLLFTIHISRQLKISSFTKARVYGNTQSSHEELTTVTICMRISPGSFCLEPNIIGGWILGLRFRDFGFRDLGFRGLGFRDLGFRALGFIGSRGLGFRDLGFRALGFRDLGFRGLRLRLNNDGELGIQKPCP